MQKTLLQLAQTLVENYDTYVEALKEELTDEQIDAVLGTEIELLSALDALLFYNRVQARRRLLAEKEEEKSKIMVSRIMRRLWLADHATEDGKIKKSVSWKFNTDLSKLPDDYKMASWNKIHSAVAKGATIPGVDVVGWFDSFRIS